MGKGIKQKISELCKALTPKNENEDTDALTNTHSYDSNSVKL